MEAFEGSFEKEKQAAELAKALQGVQLAIIPAGVPRKPGMTRQDLFDINAGGQTILRMLACTACLLCMGTFR